MLTVKYATIIGDKPTADNLAVKNCGINSAHCIFGSITISAGRGPAVLKGNPCVNASQFPGSCSYGQGKTIGETDTLSVSVSAQVELQLSMLVKLGVQVTFGYSHTWETSYTYNSNFAFDLPSGYAGWFTIAPPNQTASGAFFVSSTKNDQYQSQGAQASFTVPIEGAVIVAHSCILKPNTDPNDLMCQSAITSLPPFTITGTPGG